MAADAAPLAARHHLVTVPVDGLDEALRACPVPLSTMGRSLDGTWRTSWPRRRRAGTPPPCC